MDDELVFLGRKPFLNCRNIDIVFLMHKSQVFFYFLAAFLLGIFTASLFNFDQFLIYIGLVVAVGLIGIFGYHRNFNGKILLTGFLGIAFFFGVIRFNSNNFAQDKISVFTGLKAGEKDVEVIVNGYVDDETIIKGNRAEITLQAKELVAGDKIIKVNDRIMITTNSLPRFDYGDTASVKGVLQKPVNLTDFDYVTYLKKEGIKTTMFYPTVKNGKWKAESGRLGFWEELKISLYREIFLLKNKFENAVNKSVSEPNASFINGILLGSRQDIPDDLKEAFNKTGTTHVLAISGYNIMIISWAVLMGLVVFFKRKTAFWISVAIVCLFVILTGASASVVRAAIMGLLLSFAHGYGRLYNPKNSIILAGAVMVWLNPLALVFDIGFQLSFAAVIGLMYLYPKINNKLKKLPKLGNLKEITLMTISAQIAVAPLLVYYFKNFSLLSLPANILIVPFIPASMLLGFITGLTGMTLPLAGNIVGWFAWAVTAYQIKAIELLASIF